MVHPADRFVLLPHRRQLRIVEQLQQGCEGLASGPQQRGRIEPVEQHLHLAAQLIEQRFDVEPIALVGELHQTRRQTAELLEAGRFLAAADALLHQLAGLQHLQGHKAVEGVEGRLAPIPHHGIG